MIYSMEKENPRKHLERETKEGTILIGAMLTEKPGVNYTEQLQQKNKQEEIKKLKQIKEQVVRALKVSKTMFYIDPTQLRIFSTVKIIERYTKEIKNLKLIPAVIEESPEEKIEIQIDFL